MKRGITSRFLRLTTCVVSLKSLIFWVLTWILRCKLLVKTQSNIFKEGILKLCIMIICECVAYVYCKINYTFHVFKGRRDVVANNNL